MVSSVTGAMADMCSPEYQLMMITHPMRQSSGRNTLAGPGLFASARMTVILGLLSVPVACAASPGLGAKDVAAVERAAAAYVRTKLPAGRVVFDGRISGPKQRAAD